MTPERLDQLAAYLTRCTDAIFGVPLRRQVREGNDLIDSLIHDLGARDVEIKRLHRALGEQTRAVKSWRNRCLRAKKNLALAREHRDRVRAEGRADREALAVANRKVAVFDMLLDAGLLDPRRRDVVLRSAVEALRPLPGPTQQSTIADELTVGVYSARPVTAVPVEEIMESPGPATGTPITPDPDNDETIKAEQTVGLGPLAGLGPLRPMGTAGHLAQALDAYRSGPALDVCAKPGCGHQRRLHPTSSSDHAAGFCTGQGPWWRLGACACHGFVEPTP